MKLKFSVLGSIFGGAIGTFLGYQTDKAIDTAQRQAKNATILAQQEAAAQIQAIQSAGDVQTQRVTNEGTTQTANAKAQADSAAQSAADAAQSAQAAAESAAVYDDVVEDVNQLKQDLSDVNKIAEKAYIMIEERQ